MKQHFLNISHVEVMLIIKDKHLDMHEGKIAKLKKEKGNWVKEVLWIDEIQGYGLHKLLSKCLLVGIDDKKFHVIQECIEWINEVIMKGVAKVKEILSELGVIDDIIHGDLKQFYKQCIEGEGESILPTKDICWNTLEQLGG